MNHIKLLVATAALAVTGAMGAVNLPKEGSFDYTACWSGNSSDIAFSNSQGASSFEMTGMILSNPPGGPFDKNTFRCVGMNTMINDKAGGGNVCEAVDADGDKRYVQFFIGADGSVTRQVVSGTGKYAGMVMNTTVTTLGPFPGIKAGTFQSCNRQTGTYKLK